MLHVYEAARHHHEHIVRSFEEAAAADPRDLEVIQTAISPILRQILLTFSNMATGIPYGQKTFRI